jgi:glycosyltransferase involved in cell wall biosynthesis
LTAASVIVPARDAEATIGRTLQCLARQEAAVDFEVVVVDDGSSDETVAIAENAGPRVRTVRQERTGAAEARNLGVRQSSGPILAFLDADCFPEPGWLSAGIKTMASADLVQGRVLPAPDMPLGPFDRSLWVTSDEGLWQTANLFVTRELFDGIGGFEDWLGVELGKLMAEDLWLGWRAVRAGARTAFCDAALVHHAVFPRGPRGYLEERRRVRYFPEIARKMPELRRTMFFLGTFLSRRTAAFDLAALGVAVAAAARSPMPLASAAPYAVVAWRDRLRHLPRRHASLAAAVDAVADGLTLVELARGSARAGSFLL